MNKENLINILNSCRNKEDLKGNYIRTIKLSNNDYLKFSGNVRLDSIINIINDNYKFKVIKNNAAELIMYLIAFDNQEYIITILKNNKTF